MTPNDSSYSRSRGLRVLACAGLAGVAAVLGCSQNASDPDLVAPAGTAPAAGAQDGLDSPAAREVGQLSVARFRQYLEEAGRARVTGESVVKAVHIDDLEMAHTRLQQVVDGIPVFGGEAIVHLAKDRSLASVTDAFERDLKVDTKPSFDGKIAAERALATTECASCFTEAPKTDLFVFRNNGEDRLAYRVALHREDGTDKTSMPVLFVDAHTGVVLSGYDNLQTATGRSLYSGTVTLESHRKGTAYYLEDVGRRVGTFDMRNGQTNVYRVSDADNVFDSTAQRGAVDAQYGAAKVYDYFLTVHGRRGIDGNGGPTYYTGADGATRLITSVVHYGNAYNNAFWNGSYMTYGDGDGRQMSSLVTLDICGHEMTHGITERTAGLTYQGESGALNESMSDVFGAMVERYVRGENAGTWKCGEQCWTPGNGDADAMRHMDIPHKVSPERFTADDDPDHYSERYTGTRDNGGVHINSGIANHAFYLLAAGGTHRKGGSMTGIGADKAAKIWYRALTSYMTSGTTFRGARTATLSAAAAIHGAGSAEHTAVGRAWTLVGVN